ncbi:leucine-rich repeat protein [bacterium]|nr:leucine-rich repeat protein [bacterium]
MKRKLLRNLLISSSVIVLTSSLALSLSLMPKKENVNDLSKVINANNQVVHNNKNLLNNNNHYYLHDGFYTQLASNANIITINNITYALNSSNDTASIINLNTSTPNLVIPGIIEANNNFYNVTSIANGACFNKQIVSVSFPNSILSIGADAFANNLITSLTLPSSLISLGNNAFSNNPFYEGTVINLPANCS